MIWFLRSRQVQTLQDVSVTNSTLQLIQAGRDALSFPNAEQAVIIYDGLFGSRQILTGIDWERAGRVLQEQQSEVRNRLKYVLRDHAPMNVQLSEQPERVNLPTLESERRLTISGEDSELLDPGQLMIEVFGRDDIVGKLLILGTPGAGKTTALLSLAEQLLVGAIAKPKTTIPIVFELSTWKNDNQSIQDWLIEQLYDLYGGDRKLKRYEQWLERQVLLPLLDGLDELGMERQQKCMVKLNEFTRQYPQVVVCCRSREFEESGIRLGNLRGAVGLEPLSDRQIQTYLHQVERTGLWTQIQETPEMRQMLEPIEGEAGLLRVPLFIAIAAAIYDENQPFRTKGELFEKYIERQLSFDIRMSDRRRGLENRQWTYAAVEKEPEIQLTRHYLSWLARQLNGIREVNFLIEKMQPSWIEKSSYKRLYAFILGLIATLVVGLIAGPVLWLRLKPMFWLIFGLIVWSILSQIGIAIGRLMGRSIDYIQVNDIQPVESFQISMLISEAQTVICELKSELTNESKSGLIRGLMGIWLYKFERIDVLMKGLIERPIGALRQDLKVRSRPNQGIHNSLYNFYLSSIVMGTLLTFFFVLSHAVPGARSIREIREFHEFRDLWFLFTFFIAFTVGGGLAFVQHFCLRFVLACSGTFPFFCVPFLNYSTERRLLQRIGGRYRFIHRELLDHFAKQDQSIQPTAD